MFSFTWAFAVLFGILFHFIEIFPLFFPKITIGITFNGVYGSADGLNKENCQISPNA